MSDRRNLYRIAQFFRRNWRVINMDESVVDQIIGAVAEVEDLDMVLQRYVSTDAIRNLVKHDSNSWRLQFETQTHVVEVMGDNTILVDGERRRTLS